MQNPRTFGFLVLLAAVPGVQADWTARASVLFNSPEDLRVDAGERFGSQLDDGHGYGLAIGYDFPVFRVEAEGLYLTNDIGSGASSALMTEGEVDRLMAFGNVFVDLPLAPFFSLYGGAGIGMAKADVDLDGEIRDTVGSSVESFSWSESETVFGYQLMAGVRFQFTRFFASAGYRYLSLENTDFSDGLSSASLRGGDHVWELSAGFLF